MKQSRFTDEQIIRFLKQADAGMSVKELCRSGRKLPQTVNNMKIETSISLEMRDEEVEIYGKPNCWDIGRG